MSSMRLRSAVYLSIPHCNTVMTESVCSATEDRAGRAYMRSERGRSIHFDGESCTAPDTYIRHRALWLSVSFLNHLIPALV